MSSADRQTQEQECAELSPLAAVQLQLRRAVQTNRPVFLQIFVKGKLGQCKSECSFRILANHFK